MAMPLCHGVLLCLLATEKNQHLSVLNVVTYPYIFAYLCICHVDSVFLFCKYSMCYVFELLN